MALKADGVDITGINIDNNENINALVVDGTGFWAKEYSLTGTVGEGATLQISRQRSQYQQAPTGLLDINNANFYYGDYLQISVILPETYKITSVKINGVTKSFSVSSGVSELGYPIYYLYYTISGNTEIVVETAPFSWETVWSGDEQFALNTSITRSLTVSSITSFGDYTKVRITGKTYSGKVDFSEVSEKSGSSFSTIIVSDSGSAQRLTPSSTSNNINIAINGSTFKVRGVYINKVEVG